MKKLLLAILLVVAASCGSQTDCEFCEVCEVCDDEECEMTIKFLTPNLADDGTLTPSSEASGYPVENVQDERLSVRWRCVGDSGYSILDSCDATTGWTAAGEAATETVNTTDFERKEGAGSLNLGKSGVAATTFNYTKTMGAAQDGTDKYSGLWFYIKSADYAKMAVAKCLELQLGQNFGNYYKKEYAKADLAPGWNWLANDVGTMAVGAGTPFTIGLWYLNIEMTTANSADTIAVGDIKIDMWCLLDAAEAVVQFEYVDFDLGSAQAITAAAVAGHDLESTDSEIKIWHSDDAVTYTEEVEFTHDAGNMIEIFTSSSHRYWRVSYKKETVGDIRNVGRIYIGAYTESERGLSLDTGKEWKDLSKVRRALSGTKYADVRARVQILKTKLNYESLASMDALQALLEPLGIATPLFLNIDESSPNGDNTIYGRFTKSFSRTDPLNTHGIIPINFEEDL